MQAWALYWHIRELTPQPIALGLMGLVRFFPILIFSLIGGMVADRFNRRNILFFSQIGLTLVAVALGLLTILHQIQLWHIYVLTAIQATCTSFDQPARQSLVPSLVPKQDLPNAFSMQSIAVHIGAIAGPALTGVVIGSLGKEWVYFINAVSFLAVILALILMGAVNQPQTNQLPAQKFSLSEIANGIRFTFRKPIILSTMILDFFATFFSSANTLLPYVTRDILHVGVVQYGWLSAAQSMGSVSVGLVLSQKRRVKKQGLILVSAATVFGLWTIVFGLSRSFWLTMAALIIIGGADTLSGILRNTLRQLQTPDHLRGRMVSVNQIFYFGGPQLGEVESGLVAQLFSVPIAIVTGGIGCILAVVAVVLKWPQLYRYDGREALEEPQKA
jgi:MFS family permease